MGHTITDCYIHINSHDFKSMNKWILSPAFFTFGNYRASLNVPKQQILDYSKLKNFADDNLRSDENGEDHLKGQKTLW